MRKTALPQLFLALSMPMFAQTTKVYCAPSSTEEKAGQNCAHFDFPHRVCAKSTTYTKEILAIYAHGLVKFGFERAQTKMIHDITDLFFFCLL